MSHQGRKTAKIGLGKLVEKTSKMSTMGGINYQTDNLNHNMSANIFAAKIILTTK